MNIFNNLKNYLYANDNFIAYFNKKIYLYNFKTINTLTSSLIILSFSDKQVLIKGKNIRPIKMQPKEILIEGEINAIEFA